MNADKAKPELILNLDRPRKFVLTLGSFRKVEETFGKSIFKLIKWQDLGISDLVIILWAGLLADDKELTMEQVEELFDLDSILANFEQIKSFLGNAFDRAMPALSESDKEALNNVKKTIQEATIQ